MLSYARYAKKNVDHGEHSMQRPLLFCNIGWMKNYEGQTPDDRIIGGGRYVKVQERGEEVCNFVVTSGKVFGFVRPVRDGRINVGKLGAPKNAVSIDGIDVVITARRPGGNTVVVGWFKNATVFEREQLVSDPSALHKSNGVKSYRYEAKAEDVKLLLPEQRTFVVPRGMSGMGQSNVWYADNATNTWLGQVRQLVEGVIPATQNRGGRRAKPDHFKNTMVENAAMSYVWSHYLAQGYELEDVSKQNLGWDLEATSGTLKLRIEVKGLSSEAASIELTHNEYKAFIEKSLTYRLCIVTGALTEPALSICLINLASSEWEVETEDRYSTVKITERVAATITLT